MTHPIDPSSPAHPSDHPYKSPLTSGKPTTTPTHPPPPPQTSTPAKPTLHPYESLLRLASDNVRERENKTILLLCNHVNCSLVCKIFVLRIKFLKISFRCFPKIVLRICQKCFCSASQFSVFGNKFPNKCMSSLPSKKMDFI